MKLGDDVILAARSAQMKWGIPASVQLAQWALESSWGAHSPGNNCFGIKALPNLPTQTLPTHEVIHGHRIATDAVFARFDTIGQAFECHAKLLASAPVYHSAMECLPDVTKFIARMAPHYATDPQYAAKLNSIIKSADLTQYDKAKS